MTSTTTSIKFTSEEQALMANKSFAVFCKSGKAELVFLLLMEKILKKVKTKIKRWTENGLNTVLERSQTI